MPIIECKNLSLGYDGEEIVKNISFSLNKGDYLCIVGENGSGKSTLMKGLLGFIKPYSGEINIAEPKIGYLPQRSGVDKDFPVTVNEIVLSGCLASHRINPFYTSGDKKTADSIIHKLELDSIKDRCYQELSGGQKQRVLIARALCAAGNLLILDEPAAGLDPIITKEIYDIIFSLNQKDKMTVIMVSHDIKSAISYASHILHIGNSSAYFCSCDEYKKSRDAHFFTGGEVSE